MQSQHIIKISKKIRVNKKCNWTMQIQKISVVARNTKLKYKQNQLELQKNWLNFTKNGIMVMF